MGENPSRFQGDILPVEQVSWHQCVEFCKKMSEMDGKPYRLPSESQWEYACRAGTSTPFYFGETISSDQANFDASHVYGDGKQGLNRRQTTPVDDFRPMPGDFSTFTATCGNGAVIGMAFTRPRTPLIIKAPQMEQSVSSVAVLGTRFQERCRSAHREGSDPRKGRKDVGFRVCFSED